MMLFSFNRCAKSQISVSRCSRAQGYSRRKHGVVFIEFALILPVFVILLLGVIQYARLIQTTETVTNLSRDGARFATLGAGKTDDQITTYVTDQIAATALAPADFTINITPAYAATPANVADRQEGQRLNVELIYNLKSRVFVPAIGAFLLNAYKDSTSTPGNPVYLYHSTTAMRIINAY